MIPSATIATILAPIPLARRAQAILRKYGGSLFAPSQATCWQDSAGTTPGAQDQPVGKLTCSVGSGLYASQSSSGYRPVLRKGAKNWVLNSATLATQSVTVPNVPMTLSIYGTGSITLSGTGSGTLNGTGAGNRVSLTFTPTAGSCTFTVTGSVTSAMLETGSSVSAYVATTTVPLSNSIGPWWLDFDGSDDRLNLSAVPLQLSDDLFIVSGNRYLSGVATQATLGIGGPSPYPNVGTLGYSGSTPRVTYRDSASGIAIIVSDTSTLAQAIVQSTRKQGTEKVLRINGGQKGETDNTVLGAATLSAASIGAYGTGGSSFFGGAIYAIALGKGAITDSELKIVERYIGQLSGVSL